MTPGKHYSTPQTMDMQYSAYEKKGAAKPEDRRGDLLKGLGAAIRGLRSARGLTMKRLAEMARVSERFLAQLEGGEGNISVVRLQDVAEALGTTGADLLERALAYKEPAGSPVPNIEALLGLRGAWWRRAMVVRCAIARTRWRS